MTTNQLHHHLGYCCDLSESDEEVVYTELEFALMRCLGAFGRWQTECLASVCDFAVSGPENALLRIVRMNERPKSIKELARLTNCDDIPTIQYSMRKLVTEGLAEKQISEFPDFDWRLHEAGRSPKVLVGICEEISSAVARHRR